jgi:hypothetical protein
MRAPERLARFLGQRIGARNSNVGQKPIIQLTQFEALSRNRRKGNRSATS